MTGRAGGGLVMFTRLKTHRRMAQGVGHHLLSAARDGDEEEEDAVPPGLELLLDQRVENAWISSRGEFLTENPSFEGNSRARRCTLQK